MKIFPLGSSSKGNSTYIETENCAILIDAGFGVKKTEQILVSSGLNLNRVKAIFITHEHYDHVSGLFSITKKLKDVPVYASSKTLKSLISKGFVGEFNKLLEFNLINEVKVCDLKVSAFEVSHDSASCLAFCVFCGNKKFSICTDLGCVTKNVLKNLIGSNFVIIESNFDVKMLRHGKYPYVLKRRIESNYGHLSNYDAAKLICWLLSNGVNNFLLSHLSENNNVPDLALKTVISVLEKFNFKNYDDYFLDVVPARSVGKIYEV